MAARASYIAGFAGTATVLAGEDFGIPIYGTMAHSFIEAFDDEMAAFEAFARSRPDNVVLLLDTYDTEAAARKVVALAPRLKQRHRDPRRRLDSGDLIALSRSVRAFSTPAASATSPSLRAAASTKIRCGVRKRQSADRRLRHRHQPHHFVRRAGARLRLQLQEYAGAAETQTVRNKAPGRAASRSGALTTPTAACEAIPLARSTYSPAKPLIVPVMRAAGASRRRRRWMTSGARQARTRAPARNPVAGGSTPGDVYPVEAADDLVKLAAAVDRRLRRTGAAS